MSAALYTDRTGVTEQTAPLDVGVSLPDTIVHGQTSVTTAGTAVALGESTTLTSGITVKAKADNEGIIYLGGSTVDSTNGYELAAGEEKFVEIDDLATCFIDASVSGESVSYIGG